MNVLTIAQLETAIAELLAKPCNRGFFKTLAEVLEVVARLPDDNIDEPLLDLLEQLCQKLHACKPDAESMPELRAAIEELCGVRIPRLRLRLRPPPQTKKMKM
ncbi:hypothetical protein FJY94_06750 [Candidatus Kaiserbacteria bacterium]|nr:hypothetical protein [Candidatus Kaiserbacteria bacterium]